MSILVFESTVIIRAHRSTTYADAAYCNGPSSVVCRSVYSFFWGGSWVLIQHSVA